jgi:hypothetical protein
MKLQMVAENGYGRLMYDLLEEINLSDFNPQRFVRGAAFMEQRLHSLDVYQRAYLEILETKPEWFFTKAEIEEQQKNDPKWHSVLSKNMMFEAFVESAKRAKQGFGAELSPVIFGPHLKKSKRCSQATCRSAAALT